MIDRHVIELYIFGVVANSGGWMKVIPRSVNATYSCVELHRVGQKVDMCNVRKHATATSDWLELIGMSITKGSFTGVVPFNSFYSILLP